MKAAILGCSSLSGPVRDAQRKMKTDWPVYYADRKYHIDPKQMRLQLIENMKKLPQDTDTVLVAMGFCGGSWEGIPSSMRIVIPKVDDCITLQLHTDDMPHVNLKQSGHFYMRNSRSDYFLPENMLRRLREQYGEEKGNSVFHSWFDSYTDFDIIDTGTCDCREPHFLNTVRRNAELAGCRTRTVKGSNILLEKLVSGKWDSQFIIVEPEQTLTFNDFTENND